MNNIFLSQNKYTSGGGPKVVEKSISSAVAGDICLYDKKSKKKVITTLANFQLLSSVERYSPLGIVVIPASHGIFGYNKCTIMSNVSISGTFSNQEWNFGGLAWGFWDVNRGTMYTDIVTTSTDNAKAEVTGIVSEDVEAYLPSDKFLGDSSSVSCAHDQNAAYSSEGRYRDVTMSPYYTSGSRNSNYYATRVDWYDYAIKNCLSDFDGQGNTDYILSYCTWQPDWKTDKTIEANGEHSHSPAMCCCWRYKPEGTNEGDWYLPSMGELGYLGARYKVINESLSVLNNTYGITATNGKSADMSNLNYRLLLSSTLYSRKKCWGLSLDSMDVYDADKYVPYNVLAFLRV